MAICAACGIKEVDGTLSLHVCDDGGLDCGDTVEDDACLYVKLKPGGGIVNDQSGPDQFGSPGGGLKVAFNPNEDVTNSELFGPCVGTDSNGKITLKLDSSAAGCNALQCTPEGLYAPCPQNIHEIDQCQISRSGLPVTVNPGTTRVAGNKNWQYGNPGCCTIQGRVILEAGGYMIVMGPGFLGYVRFVFSPDGGATWMGTFPEHFEWFDNRFATGFKSQAIPVLHESQWNEQAPGGAENLIPGYEIVVSQGTGRFTVSGGRAGFEFHRDMTAVGCTVCANRSSGAVFGDPPGRNPAKSLSYENR